MICMHPSALQRSVVQQARDSLSIKLSTLREFLRFKRLPPERFLIFASFHLPLPNATHKIDEPPLISSSKLWHQRDVDLDGEWA